MPFKLKLKKSRQYNVSSKNLFVISVELLDNTTVECTLSAQSAGQECLNNVCQRLGLHQPQYFGLRFLSKKNTYWWLELQRPLKKQMDKYAQENATLHLGIMYFVSDVNMLHDEVTRYHYFLQLKSDILQGHLHCNQEQTILFASYSLQAEFGDHDAERHTTEYLANFGLLPKHVAQSKEHQEAILENVIQTHRSLQGMSQQLAEVYYIREAQTLNGYGQEGFAGKDSSGAALFVCLSLKGIFIRYMNNQQSTCFLWEQIVNLVHHKRCFGIECIDNPKVVQTFMEDSHIAKYVWKTCIQQHQFYTQNEDSSKSEKMINIFPAATMHNSLRPVAEEEVSTEPDKRGEPSHRGQLQESQESLDGLGVYHTDGRYSERISPTAMYSQRTVREELMSPLNLQPSTQHVNCSSALASSTPALQASYSHPLPSAGLRGSLSAAQLHTVSATDPAFFPLNQLPVKSDTDIEAKCAMLPSYRQAPDYDTAVKLKYGIQSASSSDMSPSSLGQLQPALVGRSSVDSYHVLPYQQAIPVQSYAQYKNYNDLSHLDIGDVVMEGSELLSSRHYENLPATCISPPVHTYSSPELASQSAMRDVSPSQVAANMHLTYQFKPPPPYPYKQSSSTPDLTKNHLQHLPVNSSPNAASSSDYAQQHQQYSYMPPHNAAETSNAPVSPFYGHGFVSNVPCPNSKATSIELKSADTKIASTPNGSSGYNLSPHRTQADLLAHKYENYNPGLLQGTVAEGTACRVTEPAFSTVMTAQSTKITCQVPQSAATMVKSIEGVVPTKNSHLYEKMASRKPANLALKDDSQSMGPMLVAAMNGLTLSQPDILAVDPQDKQFPVDPRIQALETKLAEGQVFLEFEHIIKKKSMADFMTALMPENVPRNRFKDVFPYEDNRVRLTPTNENKTGYINASHLSVSVGGAQQFYIAAQGPLPNTLYSFWQMIWEHHVSVIVMLTEVQEEGQEKCFPYWPQEDNKTLQIGEFQINRNFSMSSPTYVTCSLSLCYITSNQQRNVWHIQYTDWPDHSCPEDVQGFIRFMGEVDAVRRLSMTQQPQPGLASSPIVVHCSAGVGRSGVVIICDIMLYALDHNQPIDVPKVLTQLRLQRMLTVQTLAQYKFVYIVLVQYLRNSRLI